MYDATIQMGHRIHEESETSLIIGDHNERSAEDYEMFCRFWLKWVAHILLKFYSKSQKSNDI